MRGPAAYLQVSSRIDEDDYDFASAIIDEEIEYLRSGSLGAAEFEADRAAVIERLRGANRTAESLNTWTRQVFYDPATFTDFPDVLSFYENREPEPGRVLRGARLRRVTPDPFGDAHATDQPGDGGVGGGRVDLGHPEGGRVGADPARPDEGDPLCRAFPAAGRGANRIRSRDDRRSCSPWGASPRWRIGWGVERWITARRRLCHPACRDRRHPRHRARGRGPLLLDGVAPAQAAHLRGSHPHQVARLALAHPQGRRHRGDCAGARRRRLVEPPNPAEPAARVRS